MRSVLKLTVLFVFGFGLADVATAQTLPTKDLVAIESDLNSMCRGWFGDDPHTDQICTVRDKMAKLLGTMGYCYGKQGQSGYQMQWHKCTKGSIRP
jgi:hypothetical protein